MAHLVKAVEVEALMQGREWKENTMKTTLGASQYDFQKMLTEGSSDPILAKRFKALQKSEQQRLEFTSADMREMMKELDLLPSDLACFLDLSRSSVGRMLNENDAYEIPSLLRKVLFLMKMLKESGYDVTDVLASS